MMARKFLLGTVLSGLVGCAPAVVSGDVGVSGNPYVVEPSLAYVAPGVEVVADWATPVFFADNLYWYWDGGAWSCSAVLGGERVRVHDVPIAVGRISNPEAYAHFSSERVLRLPEHHAMRAPLRNGGPRRG